MPLSVGDKLGHYEVLSLLGAGGMGEVYRARDTTLKRDVALKVLPSTFLRDPERMARFQREAQVLASLDHPNIGHIYGIVDAEDSRGLVLALIEGPTLADRIEAGPIPLEEAIATAKQIVEALEYAHDRGVVHRDLKPANVKIAPEGVVKVLDFGLAKVLEDEPPASSLLNSPTLTLGHTRAGVILGTAAYMSPEQAVGRPVDRRSDIFSFGAVLFEMLTGKRAFSGNTTPDVLEAVVKFEPDWSVLPKETPAYLRTLLERTLAKDRKQRLQAIGEARIMLAKPQSEGPAAAAEATAEAHASSKLPWVVVIALLGLAAAGALAFLHLRAEPQPQVVKLEFPPPEGGTFNQTNGPPAVSPDGRRIAFRANVDGKSMLWVRELDSLKARMLPGTENPRAPFWAPDGRQIAFGSNGRLMKIDVTGGPATTIANMVTPLGGTWSQDDVILFGTDSSGLMRVSGGGGTPMPTTELDKSRNEARHGLPQFLPDGHHFFYLAQSSDAEKSGIFVGDLQSKDTKLVMQSATGAVYTPSSGGTRAENGYLLFVRENTLMAQPFDVGKLQTTGEAVPVAEQVGSFGFLGYFAASRNGTLAYASGTNSLQITWYDRSGKPVGTVGKPMEIRTARLSPNGMMVAVDRLDPLSGKSDIWVHDLARGTEQPLTFAGDNGGPVWSPDSLRLAYNRTETVRQVVVKSADGTGQEDLLESALKIPMDWTRDGRYLISATPNINPKTSSDLWALPLSEGKPDGKPVPLRETEFQEWHGRVSPDGRWLAYMSDDSKRSEVYVVGFPALNGHWRVSVDGGRWPIWSRDGRELYFVSENRTKMMAVEMRPGAQFQAGVPKPLFDVRLGSSTPSFDVSADGRFLIATPVAQSATMPMTVILNWQAGLKK